MRRIFSRSVVLTLVAILLGPILSMTIVASFPDLKVIDLGFAIRDSIQAANPASDEIVIVAIDDESFQETGFQWPWPRSYFAEIIGRISAGNPKVIVVDVFWYEQSANPLDVDTDDNGLPDGDEALAEAIARAGNVILVNNLESNIIGTTSARIESYNQPIPILSQAAHQLGLANFELDSDGFVRVAPFYIIREYDGGTYFTWPVLAAANYLDIGLPEQISNDSIQFAGTTLPVPACPGGTNGGCININYRGGTGSYKHIPAYQVANGDPTGAPENFTGKIVLIGATTETLHDTYPSPISGSEPPMPGVEIMANAIDTLITGDYIVRLGQSVSTILALVLAIVALLLSRAKRLLLGLLAIVALLAGYIGVWAIAFIGFDTIIPLFGPLLGLLAGFTVPAIDRAVKEEQDRRRIRNAFGFYLSADLIDQLTKDPSQLKLGGERRNMTFLFTDIRGFTTISERYDAVGLTRLINRFLTPMTDLIMTERGTIDKYMGDCIMAFWNAPLEDLDHARHACSAALRMRTRLDQLNTELRAEASADGVNYMPLKIGIGINTGDCSVGNMGSEQRFDYSVLGDNVNLASRLEGQSKNYGVDIVIGENTLRQAPKFAVIELDLIQVKGKTVPVHIFALLGDAEMKESQLFKRLATAHVRMIHTYRRQRWDEARKWLADCRNLDLGLPEVALNTLYTMYEARITAYEANPPGSDWDGSFVATSK